MGNFVTIKIISMTRIYGASDDLVLIDGEMYEEEIDMLNKYPCKFEVSDGTKGMIDFINGWKIKVDKQGSLFKALHYAVEAIFDEHLESEAKDCPVYSDVLVLNGNVEWIKIGRKKYKPCA
jgi:hypothetical protein